MKKILIGSPVHQKEAILKEFLLSLEELDKLDLIVDFYFVDDNSEESSSLLLKSFRDNMVDSKVIINRNEHTDEYVCDGFTHRWSNYLVEKVTRFKNEIISYAVSEKYDYLFFIDSDIVLNTKTLKELIKSDKDIISNIFWTRWSPKGPLLPQVWLKDAYSFSNHMSNDNITIEEITKNNEAFIKMLEKPGVYKVGGLGACTLISQKALLKGVNFDPIYNVSFWGEDRAFCIRAAAYGLEMWVNTYYPAYHIYRDEYLEGIGDYKLEQKTREYAILASDLVYKVELALESIKNYSYATAISKECFKYYSNDLAEKFYTGLITKQDDIYIGKIISKITTEKCDIKFIENRTIVVAEIMYSEEGYKNGKSFYSKKSSILKLKEIDNEWKIYEWVEDKRKIPKFIPLTRNIKYDENKLTLSMIVKNEGSRYLKRALESAREYIDYAVIIDDGSTDNTVEVIKNALDGYVPYKLIENKESTFSNETKLRRQQWKETIATNPEWMLFLDADEIFEEKFKVDIRELMQDTEVDGFTFRLYDFWNEDNYREDTYWNAHSSYRLFMVRYQEKFRYTFTNTAQHCGRLPNNCEKLKFKRTHLRLKHYGWAIEDDRREKYDRYMKLDPDGKFGILGQYLSILDKEPNLVKWNEKE